MHRRIPLFLTAIILSVPLFAQNYVLQESQSYARLVPKFQQNNSAAPLYDPVMWPMWDGSRGLMLQGNCSFGCQWFSGNDDIVFFRRLGTGAWVGGENGVALSSFDSPTTPFNHTPNLGTAGQETQYRGKVVKTQTNITGQFGNPAPAWVSDGLYPHNLYMAYIRGSSDIYAGEVWWAYSTDDGQTWTDTTTPLMYGKYHSQYGPRAIEHVTGSNSETEGFDSMSMAMRFDESGVLWAYIYASYRHPAREVNGSNDIPFVSYITYRVQIDRSIAGGLTGTRQVFYNDPVQGWGWKPHNGAFAWKDHDSNDPSCGPCTGVYYPDKDWSDATKLYPGRLNQPSAQTSGQTNGWYYYGGPQLDNLYWNTRTVTHNGTDFVMLLWNGALDVTNTTAPPEKLTISHNGVDWCGPYDVDLRGIVSDPNAINSLVGTSAPVAHPALWYGTLSGVTAYWGFLSLHGIGNPQWNGSAWEYQLYNGTQILPIKLLPNGTFPTYGGAAAPCTSRTYSVLQ